ncbi:hypothetical protein [Pontiella desulfatans]|nr:hypothetical protein [Pontiella desulfatans]
MSVLIALSIAFITFYLVSIVTNAKKVRSDAVRWLSCSDFRSSFFIKCDLTHEIVKIESDPIPVIESVLKDNKLMVYKNNHHLVATTANKFSSVEIAVKVFVSDGHLMVCIRDSYHSNLISDYYFEKHKNSISHLRDLILETSCGDWKQDWFESGQKERYSKARDYRRPRQKQ